MEYCVPVNRNHLSLTFKFNFKTSFYLKKISFNCILAKSQTMTIAKFGGSLYSIYSFQYIHHHKKITTACMHCTHWRSKPVYHPGENLNMPPPGGVHVRASNLGGPGVSLKWHFPHSHSTFEQNLNI